MGHGFTVVPLMLQQVFLYNALQDPAMLPLLPTQCRTLPSAPLHTGSCTGSPTRHMARTWGLPSACRTPCTRGALHAHSAGAAPHTGVQALRATTPGAQGCQHRRAEAPARAAGAIATKLGAPRGSAGDCDGTCRQGSSGSHRHAPAADPGARAGPPLPGAAACAHDAAAACPPRRPPSPSSDRAARPSPRHAARRSTPCARGAAARMRLSGRTASGWHSAARAPPPRRPHPERSGAAAAAAVRCGAACDAYSYGTGLGKPQNWAVRRGRARQGGR